MPCFGCCNTSISGKDMKDAVERLEDIDLETLHQRTSSIETDSSKRWDSRIIPGFRTGSETSSLPVQRKRCFSLDEGERKCQTLKLTRPGPSEAKARRLNFQKSNSVH